VLRRFHPEFTSGACPCEQENRRARLVWSRIRWTEYSKWLTGIRVGSRLGFKLSKQNRPIQDLTDSHSSITISCFSRQSFRKSERDDALKLKISLKIGHTCRLTQAIFVIAARKCPKSLKYFSIHLKNIIVWQASEARSCCC
jgi:hypothetical protein